MSTEYVISAFGSASKGESVTAFTKVLKYVAAVSPKGAWFLAASFKEVVERGRGAFVSSDKYSV